jgi:glycogen synthase
MQIVIVAAELAPTSNATGLGVDVAGLSTALMARDHQVHVIAPIAAVDETSTGSLAKRLRPVEVESNGARFAFARYDGRTTTGVEAHFLSRTDQQGDAGTGPEYWAAFSAAAVDVLGTLSSDKLWCVSWNAECAAVPVRDTASRGSKASHLLLISRLDPSSSSLLGDAITAADRVLVIGRSLTRACRSKGLKPLTAMLRDGRAHGAPLAGPGAPAVHRADKASAKAALQANLGLPVRPDLPLVLFAEPPNRTTAGALASYLRGDAQAVAVGGSGLDSLVDRYPDRLALLKAQHPVDAMLGADGCLVTDEPMLVVQAMSRGAIPVTTPDCGEEVIDLEPSLASGSGFVARDVTTEALAEALARLSAAYRTGQPFTELTERIPGYATSWDDISRRYEQLIAEAESAAVTAG